MVIHGEAYRGNESSYHYLARENLMKSMTNLWWSVWRPLARRRLSKEDPPEEWAWDGGGGGGGGGAGWLRCDWTCCCCCDCCCCIMPATACAYCIMLNAPILEWWCGISIAACIDAACALAAAADCDCNTVAKWAEAAAAEEVGVLFEALCCCCNWKIFDWWMKFRLKEVKRHLPDEQRHKSSWNSNHCTRRNWYRWEE